MNIKKVLLFLLVSVMLIACINTASAGWFDFLGGEGNEVNASIADETTTYKSVWIRDNGTDDLVESTSSTGENVSQGYEIISKISLDLSNASSAQKDKINKILGESDKINVTICPPMQVSNNLTLSAVAKYSDDKLSIDAKDLFKGDIFTDIDEGNWVITGEFIIESGNTTLSSSDDNITINF